MNTPTNVVYRKIENVPGRSTLICCVTSKILESIAVTTIAETTRINAKYRLLTVIAPPPIDEVKFSPGASS